MPHLTGIFGDEASGLRERGTQMTPTLGRDSSLFSQEADHIHVLVALLRGGPPVPASVMCRPLVFLLLPPGPSVQQKWSEPVHSCV